MPLTRDEIVSKYERRYRAAITDPETKANYDAAKSHMKSAFDALPFKDSIKRKYSRAIDAAVYDPRDWWVEKAKAGYIRKMF